MTARRAVLGSWVLAATLGVACTRTAPTPAPSPREVDPIAHLRAFEDARRAEARFLETTPQDRAFGADPYDLAPLRDGRIAGILRGRDALVVLNDTLHEVARIATPRSPSAVVVYRGRPAGALRDDDILVASEVEPLLAHYRPHGTTLERLADVKLDDVYGARGLATGPEGVVYLVEEHDDRLVTLRFNGAAVERQARRLPAGPIRLRRTRSALFALSVLGHATSAFKVDDDGLVGRATATATIDGPFWGFDAVDEPDGDALLVAGGVEDHPLDRRDGFFGWVDSFVYVYRWSHRTGELRRTAAINVAEHGLIVPKAIAFANDGTAVVTSYGGASAVRLAWRDGLDAAPTVTKLSKLVMSPGASAIVRTSTGFALANPVLDAWVKLEDRGASVTVADPSGHDARTDRERLGEALFFTGLMAPGSTSDGAKSRFSCETCHFEGYVDGRIHHTGRDDVHATTKPLVGLFNNRPHFSRALDPDLSAVAENEFRVAGAPSTTDPHFAIDVHEVPWLADLGLPSRQYDAAELRVALMSFLMTWTHRTNPRAAEARAFSNEERAGALAFKERCERCHEARAAADAPATRVAFERWESLIFTGGGPLVWASDAYEKTGITPYVHEHGARVPSLRRVYKKRPYFTNGSAPDIATVLRRVRFTGASFSHDDAAGGEALAPETIRALASFIDLL